MQTVDLENQVLNLKDRAHRISLDFQDVTCRVPGMDKPAVDGASGHLEPGQMLVIMGPSGSGKTTLLNAIAGRIPHEGRVAVNGEDGSLADHKRYIAYITQDDLIFSNLTVKENLSFTAELRLPDGELPRVTEVLDCLDLARCADSPVGGSQINFMGKQVRGVSGGERRKAIIGNALLTNPSLLLLDEPTSGLDSESADSLLATLEMLAKQGRTVIATLHQPSSDMFRRFDQLMLLSEGRVAYYGPASEALGHFASLGHPCPNYSSPPEFLLKLLKDPAVLQLPRAPRAEAPRAREESAPLPAAGKFNRNWFQQVEILTRRSWLLNKRNFNYWPYVQIFLIGLLIGFLWLRLSFTDANVRVKDAALAIGLLFGVGFTQAFLPMTGFPVEKMNLVRERATGSYYLSAYFIAKKLTEMPFETLFAVLYAIPAYWLVGFRADAWFLLHLFVMILTSYTSSSFGLCLSAFFTNIRLGLVVMTLLLLGFILTTGFFIPIEQLPVWLRWISWISYYRYAYEALIYIEYRDRLLTLVPGTHFFDDATLASFGNATAVDSNLVFPALGMVTSLWISLGASIGFFFAFNALAYAVIALWVA